jgi:hypothetical protein
MSARRWFLPQTPDVLAMLRAQAAATVEGIEALDAWARGEAGAADRVRELEHAADDAGDRPAAVRDRRKGTADVLLGFRLDACRRRRRAIIQEANGRVLPPRRRPGVVGPRARLDPVFVADAADRLDVAPGPPGRLGYRVLTEELNDAGLLPRGELHPSEASLGGGLVPPPLISPTDFPVHLHREVRLPRVRACRGSRTQGYFGLVAGGLLREVCTGKSAPAGMLLT